MNAADRDIEYACPRCAYDVGHTLSAGIGTCPECGGTIDEHTCDVGARQRSRRFAVAIYLSLLFAVPLAAGGMMWLLGDQMLGQHAPALRVLGLMIGYLGATVCVLGWPTGAGYIAQQSVPGENQAASMLVFALCIALGGMSMAAGLWVPLMLLS